MKRSHFGSPVTAEADGQNRADDTQVVLRAAERDGHPRLLETARDAAARLERDPRDAEALQALGLVAQKCEQRESALRLIRRAMAQEPRRVDFVGNLGTVFQDMGRFDEAIDCYRRVLAAMPDNPVAHNNIGNTLQERGDLEQAVLSYRAALASQPGYFEAWINLGNTLQKLDRTEEAIASFQRALRLKPNFAPALMNLGTTLQKAGREDEAVACFRRAVTANPASTPAHGKLMRLYLDRGDTETLEGLIAEARRHGAALQMAAACEAFSALIKGDKPRFEALYGHLGLPHREDLSPPDGWPDIASFNRALEAEIEGHPSFKWIHDSYDTTWRGFVEGLLDKPGPAVAALGRMIRAAVERFAAGLERVPGHPFLGAVPRDFTIDLWATILQQGGYHPPHHHEGNWLSGTYYAKVPAAAAAERNVAEGARPASILFDGFTELPGVAGAEGYVRAVAPHEGLLVLFPSYFMHQTVPFAGEERRISLAFDIKPAS